MKTTKPRTPWQDLIEDIVRNGGLIETEIARKLNVGQSAIHRLRHGEIRDPRYGTGARLLKLHKKHVKAGTSEYQERLLLH